MLKQSLPIYYKSAMKSQPYHVPKTPGIYFFRENGNIIYIGKAQNLKMRISSYFAGRKTDIRKRRMVHEADALDWRETESDVEALILEAEFIKKHRPKYNVLMRDDKQYLYVGFTKEKFPKIIFTHQPSKFPIPKSQIPNKPQIPNSKNKNLKARSHKLTVSFIGPFTDAWAARYILKTLRRAFPYCTCKEIHKRRCQMAEIGRCLGICCLVKLHFPVKEYDTKQKEYKKNILYIKNILSGKHQHVLKTLEREMKIKSAERKYEEATEARNQIWAIENIFKHRFIIKRDEIIYKNKGLEYLKNLLGLKKPLKRIEAYDISNIQGKYAVGSMAVFTDGQPDKSEYRKFRIRMPNRPNDTAMIYEVISRRIGHPEWPYPDVMLIDGGKGQLNAALAIFRHRKSKDLMNIKFVALAKREEELYLPNDKIIKLKEGPPALLHLLQYLRNEAHRFAVSYHRKRRSRFLKIQP